jgi:tetratricopeptide (TPR) repeat protein
VGAIKRDPTPPGPVTDFFDFLHQLHMEASLPSVREIETKIRVLRGHGQISRSTIHNIFRGPHVPRWHFLELVVEALQGDVAQVRTLWQAAQRYENATGVVSAEPSVTAPPIADPVESVAMPSLRIWSNEIPPRNPNFSGRGADLDLLRSNLVGRERQHPAVQVISGEGGIGKTEIATEFIHRHRDKYGIIWWIRAEHLDRVRDALVGLGQRLELRQAAAGGGRDRAITAVMDTLESGVQPSWLLVYDNAAMPLELQRYLPKCLPGGHIIITSRLRSWPAYMRADNIEVALFSVGEAVSFLRRRVPALEFPRENEEDEETRRAEEAGRLAQALEGLPIATEYAAAYLAETKQGIDDYIDQLGEKVQRLRGEGPSDFPAPISAAWEMSTALLNEDAGHLSNLCAFFSPEPIAAELLLRYAGEVTEPPGLRDTLSHPRRFRAAASRLARLSLAKVNGARDLIQMHRVVQALTRSRLDRDRPDAFRAYRAAVEIVLAASNPGNPDRAANDVAYDLSLQHLESDRSFFETGNEELRRLIIDQVRRLHLRGGHAEAMRFGQDALEVWRNQLGQDDLHVLSLAVEVAIAMRWDGHAADASDLIQKTLRLLKREYGDEHEVTLLCANTQGADLRTRSQFEEALDQDLDLLPKFESVFGVNHDRTMNVRNNLAADYRRLGRFREALEIDQRTFQDRRDILGPADQRTLTSYDAVARDLRGLGLYQESLDTAREVMKGFATAGGRENLDLLNARKGFAVALRKVGYPWEALQESEEVVQRYRDYLGPEHTYTLRAAANLINDRRAVGYTTWAEELAEEVLDRCREAGFPFDLGYGTMVNLASVLREDGRVQEALRTDSQGWRGLAAEYGDLHPLTLEAGINYASDLAACGDLPTAIQIGQETLSKSRNSLGENHPDTLMATVNLAIDQAALGNTAEADQLLADALRRYEDTLTTEHPEALAAARWTRLTAEIEPY